MFQFHAELVGCGGAKVVAFILEELFRVYRWSDLGGG
jgi:hypothetical protein